MAQVLLVGHSHTNAIQAATADPPRGFDLSVKVVHLESVAGGNVLVDDADGAKRLHPQLLQQLVADPDHPRRLVASSVGGNTNYLVGLLEHPSQYDFVLPDQPDLPRLTGAQLLPYGYMRDIFLRFMQPHLDIIGGIREASNGPMIHIEAPPPIGDDSHVKKNLDAYFKERFQERPIAPRWLRFKLWRLQSQIARDYCLEKDIEFVTIPPETTDAEGFLTPVAYPNNATHANEWYGKKVLIQLQETAERLGLASKD